MTPDFRSYLLSQGLVLGLLSEGERSRLAIEWNDILSSQVLQPKLIKKVGKGQDGVNDLPMTACMPRQTIEDAGGSPAPAPLVNPRGGGAAETRMHQVAEHPAQTACGKDRPRGAAGPTIPLAELPRPYDRIVCMDCGRILLVTPHAKGRKRCNKCGIRKARGDRKRSRKKE